MKLILLAAAAVCFAARPAESQPATYRARWMGDPASSGWTMLSRDASVDSAVAERGVDRTHPSDQTESRPERATSAAGARAILRSILRSLRDGPLGGFARPEAAAPPAGHAEKKAGDGAPACGRSRFYRAPSIPPAAFDELGFYRPLVDAATEQVADSASGQRPEAGVGRPGGGSCAAGAPAGPR